MSYLGRGLEQVDNISKLDNITFNGGTTYALTKDSAAFTPISSNAILISIDGVVQQGNFSVSGTNIVFNFSPTSSNTCDFIMHYGTGVAFTPADSSITKDKANFISTSSSAGLQIKGDGTTDGTLQLNCSQNSHGIKLKSPNHASSSSYTLTFPATDPAANKMLQTDGSGNLSFVDAPSGTLVKVGDVRTNSAAGSHSLTGIFSDTYDKYFFSLSTFPDVSNNAIQFRFLDSSNNDVSTGYYGASFGRDQSGNSVSHSHNGHDNITLSNGHSSARAFHCQGYIVGATSGITNNKQVMWQAAQWDNVNVFRTQVGGYTNVSATDYTGMKIKSNSNNLVGISLQVYGIVDTKHYNGS